jgi:hypothetical protein
MSAVSYGLVKCEMCHYWIKTHSTTVSLMTIAQQLRQKRKWLDIEMTVREMGWRGTHWTNQAQDTSRGGLGFDKMLGNS